MIARRLAPAIAALAVLAAIAAPAQAAGPIKVTSSLDKDGPWAGGGVNPLTIPLGAKEKVYYRVKNRTNDRLGSMTLDDVTTPSNPPGYVLRWFKGDDQITTEVVGPGFPFALAPKKVKYFRATIKYAQPSAGFCHGTQATANGARASADFHRDPAYSAGAYYQVNSGACL